MPCLRRHREHVKSDQTSTARVNNANTWFVQAVQRKHYSHRHGIHVSFSAFQAQLDRRRPVEPSGAHTCERRPSVDLMQKDFECRDNEPLKQNFSADMKTMLQSDTIAGAVTNGSANVAQRTDIINHVKIANSNRIRTDTYTIEYLQISKLWLAMRVLVDFLHYWPQY